MPPRDLSAVYATVASRDRDRLRKIAAEDGITLSQFIRSCVDDYLDQVGQESLVPIGNRGARPGRRAFVRALVVAGEVGKVE